MKIRDDIVNFTNTLPENINLVIATKYLDIDEMQKLYDLGYKNFGENRVESFLNKYDTFYGKEITWHFIGHLQRNKADKIINKIDYLHSLDSLKLAKLIEEKRTTPLKVFIEVSINEEENKNGVKVSELDNFVSEILKYSKIDLVGLMMMSIKFSDDDSLNNQFSKLVIVKKHLEEKFKIKIPYLSMGMSDDYKEAIKQGTTHIRLGRILFKE